MTKKILTTKITEPIWLSISEAAKIGGVGDKTIRRAVKEKQSVQFRIINDRYYVELKSLILYLHRTTKLKNKLDQTGIGQYIKEWIK